MPVAYFDSRGGLLQLTPVDTGIGLSVTPTLWADGFIVLDIALHVSTLQSASCAGPPTIYDRWNKTSARLRSGGTVVFSDLLDEWSGARIDETRPFLSDLPVLGELFRNPPERLLVTVTATLEP